MGWEGLKEAHTSISGGSSHSLLLHGESGTGKTLFGKYIAYKLGLPFVYLNFSNTIESYLGETSKNIDKAFNFIENQKCVFIIDELDAIGLVRGEESVSEMSRITIALMQALDRVKNDVIIVSATNRLDMIDKALLRRFTIRYEVKRFSEHDGCRGKKNGEIQEKFYRFRGGV